MAGPSDLADEHDAERGGGEPAPPSLADDLLALLDDGKTYAEAELAYQKSRGAYAANRAKYIAAYGAAAFGVFHLALIALTVGAIFALIPLVGPWAATGIVVAVLLVIGFVLASMLKGKIDDIRAAFGEDSK